MNRCEKAVTCEPESPRQVLVAPLACIVYKKHLLPTVKNSKISYKNLGLEPKGENIVTIWQHSYMELTAHIGLFPHRD